MKAVIRQEIKSRYKIFLGNLLLISLVSLSFGLTGSGNIYFDGNSRSILNSWLMVAFQVVYFGIPIYCLVSYIKLIKSMVFQDTKYLLLSVPKRSYLIFGGTYLTILVEFLLYAIVMFFWFIIAISSVQNENILFITGITLTKSFISNLHYIFSYFFIRNLKATVQAFSLGIIYSTFVAMVFSFSFTLFAALFKHKKFPKILNLVAIYFIFDLTVRALVGLSNRLHLKGPASLWVPASITAVLAIGFFIGTSWLFEKKIEG